MDAKARNLKRWSKLNDLQREYAMRMGSTPDNMTDRQYNILLSEKPEMWEHYQWHFDGKNWNDPADAPVNKTENQ